MVLNLLFLSESCLEESRGWAAAAGWCRNGTGCRARGFVSFGVDPTALGVPSWGVPTAALVTSMSWAPATLVMLAYSRFVGMDGASARVRLVGIRVNTKLGTLSLSEGILLPRVHDEEAASFSRASFRSLWNNLLEP